MKKLFAILLVMLLLMPAAMAEVNLYYVDGGDADRVHLRREPSTQAESLGLYFAGTGAIVIRWEADWSWVMIGDVQGYMMSKFLTREATAPRGPWYQVDNPQSGWANLRLSPSMEGEAALHPNNGTAVRILGETADGWSYVECNGTKGYMKTNLLSPMENAYTVQRTTILAQEGLDSYIHQYIAPNGQVIYFTADLEEPIIDFVDVDFDGYDDIVITTGRWAKSFTVRFYVYDSSGEYVLVRETTRDEGLMNYALFPEYGLVGTYIANGNAGLCHETCLYRWEGNDLECIRRAYSENYTETVWAEDRSSYTTTTYTDLFFCNVYDYATGVPEGEVIFSTGPMGFDEFLETSDAENEALWQDLR